MKKTCLTTVLLFLLAIPPAGNILAQTDLPGIPLLLLNDIYVPDGAVLSASRQVWMDRNLGATRVAASSTDATSYGDLYQWSWLTDGHEKRNSAAISTLSSGATADIPGHANFIAMDLSPFDWRDPQNNDLWQGINGTNNSCPPDFRIPTDSEWAREHDSWNTQDAAGAFASPLNLVVGGNRYYRTGNPNINNADTHGYYLSSTVASHQARHLTFSDIGAGNASIGSNNVRAYGKSVRCIMD